MKRVVPAQKTVLLSLLLAVLAGCSTMESAIQSQPTAHVESTVPQTLPPYSGPKARIAVARMNVTAAKGNSAIGDGLRDMLVTTLMETNRFTVVERQDLNAILGEQELSASGAVSQAARVKRGQIKGADLLVVGTVSEFEPHASGMGGGVGGGGWGGIVLGGIGAMTNKAHIGIDIRIIDAVTSEVLAAKHVVGEARDNALGALVGAPVGGGALGGGLGMYANTPTEKAVRICIGEAVSFISQAIPPQYFKY
jgi:curli biogenesis system outer membrane secretion channel CsgG